MFPYVELRLVLAKSMNKLFICESKCFDFALVQFHATNFVNFLNVFKKQFKLIYLDKK